MSDEARERQLKREGKARMKELSNGNMLRETI